MPRIIETQPRRRVNVRVERELLAHRPEIEGSTHHRVARPDARVMKDTVGLIRYTRLLVGAVAHPISNEEYLKRVQAAEECRATLEQLAAQHQAGELSEPETPADFEYTLHPLQQEMLGNLEAELQAVRDNQANDPFTSNNRFTDNLLAEVELALEEWSEFTKAAYAEELPPALGEEIVNDLKIGFIVAEGSLLQKVFGISGWVEVVHQSTGEVLAQYFIAAIPNTSEKQRTCFKELPERPLVDGFFEFGHQYLNDRSKVLGRGKAQTGPEADKAFAKQNVDPLLLETDAFQEMLRIVTIALNNQIRAKLGMAA